MDTVQDVIKYFYFPSFLSTHWTRKFHDVMHIHHYYSKPISIQQILTTRCLNKPDFSTYWQNNLDSCAWWSLFVWSKLTNRKPKNETIQKLWHSFMGMRPLSHTNTRATLWTLSSVQQIYSDSSGLAESKTSIFQNHRCARTHNKTN